jgi:transposase
MNFAVCGLFLGICGKKIYEWYRNVLSGFTNQEVQKQLHEYDGVDLDLIDKKTKQPKVIPVPIFAPENLGQDMALDDKNIGGEGYTILSNKKTGKIALMAMTNKAKLLCDLLGKMPTTLLMQVKTISKDLAVSYDWVARTVFLNAVRIADKFHVIQLGMEALQAVRIRYRQEVLSLERKAKEEWKKTGKKMKDFSRFNPVEVLINGETVKELLAKSRYLLFKFESEWTDTQKQRAQLLFEHFPKIKEAYGILCAFRNFYKCKTGEAQSQHRARESLEKWYLKAKSSDIEEIKNFLHTVKSCEGEILNYFDEGHTNAFAESLNSKIQNFVRSNYGIRDRDFFHFRVKKHFS